MTPQENKPDFEAMAKNAYPEYYGDRFFPNNAEDNIRQKDRQTVYTAGCDHVWSTFVVPLQEENDILKKAVTHWREKDWQLSEENKSLRDEVESLKEEIEEERLNNKEEYPD